MTKKDEVWVVDDDQSIRWVLERALAREGLTPVVFDNAEALLRRLAAGRPGVVISDVRMPGMDGLALLEEIKQAAPDLPVIIITAYSDLDRTVSAFQGGAYEYLPKPFDIDELLRLVKRARRRRPEERPAPGKDQAAGIIGAGAAMQEVFRAIGRLSTSHLTVLITGESGVGKELVARALHRHSPRAGQPFIAINVAAIPRELLESELFGHEKGAFTGAAAQRQGRFEQAHGGALFLDEIGDMPADLQTRLLRVLSDGEFYRVGGQAPLTANVRVIAATHQDLDEQVKNKIFREDLFHRLNVIRLRVPPLRERREDIPTLTEHFLRRAALELGAEPKQMPASTQAFLNGLDWPGNVRQLENCCRRLTVMAPGKEIHREDLPPELNDGEPGQATDADWPRALRRWAALKLHQGNTGLLDEALPEFERVLLEEALRQAGGHRQEAAKLLGWGRNTLAKKIAALEVKA